MIICPMDPDVAELIDIHSAAGRRFEAGGVRSFVREQGSGPDVVLLHGVPTSSFLYRKVIPRLADQGLRAVAFDFPGLGLAERPRAFDYSWSGLARWLGEAVDALGLDRCHLVVHDIGGPDRLRVGDPQPGPGALADGAQHDAEPGGFRRPWTMRAVRGPRDRRAVAARDAARRVRRAVSPPGARPTARRCRTAEIYAHHALLHRVDGGRAFLRIMRGFELTAGEAALPRRRARPSAPTRPGSSGASATRRSGSIRCARVQRVLGVDEPVLLPAKHFLQEDQAAPVAYVIADHVAPLG